MRSAALAIAALGLAGCSHETPRMEKPPTPVRIALVESYTPQAGERYSASLLPYRQVNIGFRVAGYVQAIHQVKGADGRMRHLEIGDLVAAGTVLAQLRERDYDLQVGQATGQLTAAQNSEMTARAQLLQAEAAAAKASLDYERARTLFDAKALTKPDLDAAKAQFDATRAQVEAARSQIEAAGGQLRAANATLGTASLARADTQITAPFTGAVVQRSVEVGSLVASGAPAFVLADVSSVKASFGVPDISVIRLKPGVRLRMKTEAMPGRDFSGVVSAVAAVADPNTRLFQAELTIPNRSMLLRPGMIGSVILGGLTRTEPALVVPLGAVVRGKGSSYGFAVVTLQGNKAHIRPVTLGRTYGDRIAVTGLTEGEQVVTTGASMLAEGDRVEVIR